MEKKRKWISKALENSHGQFRKMAEAAGETTKQFAREHAGDKGKTGKQARLAKTLMDMHRGAHKVMHKMYGTKGE